MKPYRPMDISGTSANTVAVMVLARRLAPAFRATRNRSHGTKVAKTAVNMCTCSGVGALP